jgi:hypothetical protein
MSVGCPYRPRGRWDYGKLKDGTGITDDMVVELADEAELHLFQHPL